LEIVLVLAPPNIVIAEQGAARQKRLKNIDSGTGDNNENKRAKVQNIHYNLSQYCSIL
jgi:hypothetical protein